MNIFSTFRTNLKTKQFGFTLIELLIVMVIIAVLATIGLATYSKATQSAKNSKAIGDMKSIEAAFEQNYTELGGRYTTTTAANTCIYTNLSGGAVPTAPTGVTYDTPVCAATTYCACAKLLGTSPAGANGTTNCAGAVPGSYYCVRQKQ